MPTVFYMREQCRALAHHKHGSQQAFEKKLLDKRNAETCHKERMAVAEKALRNARISWLQARLEPVHLQLDLNNLDECLPEGCARWIRDFVSNGQSKRIIPSENALNAIAGHLMRKARKDALLTALISLTPHLWPHHSFTLEKFAPCPAVSRFLQLPIGMFDPNTLSARATQAAECVLREAERADQARQAIVTELQYLYQSEIPLAVSCQTFVSDGVEWAEGQGLISCTGTARTRLLDARKAAQGYHECFLAQQSQAEEKRQRRKQCLDAALAPGLLPITERSDVIIKQYYDSYVNPVDDTCLHHDTFCLRGTALDIARRYVTIMNSAKLDRELSTWMPDHTGYASLRSSLGRELYENFGRSGGTFSEVYTVAAKIYRTELLDIALSVAVPSFSWKTATPECEDIQWSFIHSTSPLIPMNARGSSSISGTVSTTPSSIILPDHDGLEQVVTRIYELENVRLRRVRQVEAAVTAAGLQDCWKAGSVVTIYNAMYTILITDKKQCLQAMLDHWIYDTTYPSADLLDIAIQQGLLKKQAQARVQCIHIDVRNHPEFQSLFADAYERHDFINGFYMKLIYRCSPAYQAYINSRPYPTAASTSEVVEELVRMVKDVRNGTIPDVVCQAVHTYFTDSE
ncbi:hypothetical protein HDV00_008156 [Rhizophlyctis rosea]|nr:hypothetical protein HDV00_008156 [Rhizophlyctis rosea]